MAELQKRLTVFYSTGTFPAEGYEEATEHDLRKKISEIEKNTDKLE